MCIQYAFLSNAMVYCYIHLMLLLLLSRFSHVWLCATPEMTAHQAPLSLGFSRQEHWSGLPFPSPMHESEKWKWSRSVVSNSSRPHRLQPTRLLCPWVFQARVLEWGAIAFSNTWCYIYTNTYHVSHSNSKMALLCCSVAKSCLTLQPHGLQHSRLLCPPLSPQVCSNSCPLSRWCYLTTSSSTVPFSYFIPSFPASGSFPVSRIFALGDQSVGASATGLPINIQGWFPLGLTGLISF